MKRRRLLLILLLLPLLLGGLLLVPSVRWPVYGWLRGEAFYQGMPTSWWAEEIEDNHQHQPLPDAYKVFYNIRRGEILELPTTDWLVEKRPSAWDRWLQHVIPGTNPNPRDCFKTPFWQPNCLKFRSVWGFETVSSRNQLTKSPLINGSADAVPVLLALICNPSPKVRRVAVRGLSAQAPDNPEVIAILLDRGQDFDELVRSDVADALKMDG